MGVSKELISEMYDVLDEQNEVSVGEKDLWSSVISLASEDDKGLELLVIVNALLVANLTVSPNEEIARRAQEIAVVMDLDQELIDTLIEMLAPYLED